MSQNQSLRKHLEKLSYVSSKERRDAIETLIKIYRNIQNDPHDKKYRKIKLDNHIFVERVWSFPDARRFMEETGWQSDGTVLTFENESTCLSEILNILMENRITTPLENDWVEETKHEGKSSEQLREEELKDKAVKEREWEMQKYLKEKEYRKQLNETIKAEMKSDRERRKLVKPKYYDSDENNSSTDSRHKSPSQFHDSSDDGNIHGFDGSAGSFGG